MFLFLMTATCLDHSLDVACVSCGLLVLWTPVLSIYPGKASKCHYYKRIPAQPGSLTATILHQIFDMISKTMMDEDVCHMGFMGSSMVFPATFTAS